MLLNETRPSEEIRLFLCQPDRTVISELPEAYDITAVFKLGNINELQFRLPYQVDIDHRLVRNPHVDGAIFKYLVKACWGEGQEEWYIIQDSNPHAEEKQDYQEILCFSLPYELNDKIIKGYSAESVTATQALNAVLSEALWTVGYVNAAFDIKYRSIEMSGKVLQGIFTVAETFGAVIIWDTVQREVNLFRPDQIGTFKGLTFDYGKYLQTLNKSLDLDEFCTRLRVYGKDGLTINAVNLGGSGYLEDFTYFLDGFSRDGDKNVLRHSRYMSDGLCHALYDYTEHVQNLEGSFSGYLDTLETLQLQLASLEQELTVLNNDLRQILDAIDVKQSSGQDASSELAQRQVKEAEIEAKEREISVQQSAISGVNRDIWLLGVKVRKHIPEYTPAAVYSTHDVTVYNGAVYACQVPIDVPEEWNAEHWQYLYTGSSHFTLDQFKELNNYIIDKEITNEYIFEAAELLSWGWEQLALINTPQIIIDIDVVDLQQFLDGECALDHGKLNIGDIVYIHYDKFYLNLSAKIIELTRNYDDGSVSLSISNVEQIRKDLDKFTQMLNSFASSAATVDMSKYQWNTIQETRSEVNQLLNEVWDSSKHAINAGVNESVLIDRRGITVFDPLEPDKFVRLTHGVIGITADGGHTYHQAIDGSGIYGERIIGQIIAGSDLTITTGNGDFLVNETGVRIKGTALTIEGGLSSDQLADGVIKEGEPYNGVVIDAASGLVITRNDHKTRARLDAVNGLVMEKYFNSAWAKLLYADTEGNLIIKGTLDTGSVISNTSIQGGTITIGSGFNVNSYGYLTASGADIQGSIDCSSLSIAGTNILNELFQIQGSVLASNSVGANKLKTNELIVGTNIAMGPNATISWSNVTSKPNDLAYQSDIPTLPSYITSTKITSTTIQSPTIIGGSITSETTIDVGTDVRVGDNIYLGSQNSWDAKRIYFNDWASIGNLGDGIALYSITNILLRPAGKVYIGSTVPENEVATVSTMGSATAVFG